jgi:uncharacterized membrane protein
MAKTTIVFGSVLVLLGLFAYFVLSGETKSMTAMIPAFFGVPIVVLGLVATKDGARKHAMHAAAALSLLGLLGTARGLMKLPTLLRDADSLERPAAIGVQSLMFLLCLVFLAMCVASFVKARKAA